MSTRGMFTIKGKNGKDSFNIYKHHDMYPEGAAAVIRMAFDVFAWPLPRYESDELAAAIVAAAKCSGIMRVMRAPDEKAPHYYLDESYMPGGELARYRGGGTRLLPQGKPLKVASAHCSDIRYRYEIFQSDDGGVRVCGYSVDAFGDEPSEQLLFGCVLDNLATAVAKVEAA